MSREHAIQKEIMLALGSRQDTRVFRNNCGKLQDRNGQWVSYGLMRGSADLIGWQTRTITAADVGKRMAVFLSVEIKSPTGIVRPDQKRWLDAVEIAGGIGVVARSVDDALQRISK
jgi:hypothetical protein